MKIGIITIHAVCNFGAVLQAYGMQQYLISLGYDAYIVDYRPEYFSERYKAFSYSRAFGGRGISKLKSLIREVLVYPIRQRRKMYFDKFINKFLKLYPLSELIENNDFDIFLFGSDQIWNPMLCNGFDSVYWGSYPSLQGKRLIAYAPSMGSLNFFDEEQKIMLFKKLVSFSAISCRELESAEYLSRGLNVYVPVVLDPVLLAGRKTYEEIATPKDNLKPFLLLFTLGNNNRTSDVAYRIAKENGLRVIEIVSYQTSLTKATAKQALSVQDFLGYIRSAKIVVTSSFHGTALSVLFEKELYYVPDDVQSGERAANLLQMLGIGNRVWDEAKYIKVLPIDYNRVNNILDIKRKESVKFIDYNLKLHI